MQLGNICALVYVNMNSPDLHIDFVIVWYQILHLFFWCGHSVGYNKVLSFHLFTLTINLFLCPLFLLIPCLFSVSSMPSGLQL